MSSISWLHISDLHFGSQDKSRRAIRDTLKEYIEKKSKNGELDIDYLFITGDLIFAKELHTTAKRREAYRDAYKYITELYTIIWGESKIEDMWDRVFIVPGNHDVIRDEQRKSSIDGIVNNYKENKYTVIAPSFKTSFRNGIKAYLTYMPDERKKKHPESSNPTHFITKTDKVNILHIYSIISSGKDKEEGSLILGSELLENVLNNIDNDNPIIAISHHNIDCLDREEQKKIEMLLKKHNIYLLLCGHTHERESSLILRYNQSKILYTFTAGALMDGNTINDIVIMKGEMNFETKEGAVYSYKWLREYGWTEDNDFGLAQSEGQGNVRFIRSDIIESPYYTRINEKNDNEDQAGLNSIIVSHTAPERTRAFTDVNEKASKSLSVYGIGITHVSKDKNLMEKILKSGGSIRLCMMDPTVFKNGNCDHLIFDHESLSSVRVKIENCNIDEKNFCIGATHMNAYIRDEYAEDVQKSYNRIKKFKDEIDNHHWNFEVRLLRSFVPISINIINEEDDDAELIVEYNMPFVEKRLLLQANKKENGKYYAQLIDVFEAIWNQSVEVNDDN